MYFVNLWFTKYSSYRTRLDAYFGLPFHCNAFIIDEDSHL